MNMTYYKESQSFITKWVILLILLLLGILLYDLYSQYQAVKSVELGVSFWVLMLVILCLVGIRLNVTIDETGIQLKFFPFVRHKVWKWTDMDHVYVTEYSLLDYGGWGYRVGREGIAYTTKGRYGIQLVLKNGRKVLIGIQDPERLKPIVSRYFGQVNEQ